MGRSLLKDVDLDTLYSMRREGMNNAEIADALGVSRTAIIRYIGSQPKELRKKYELKQPKESVVRSASTYETIPACLVVDRRTVALTGIYGRYDLDIKEGCLEIHNACGQNMIVSKDMLGDFINELSAIKRKMEVLTFENEAW